MRERVFFYNTLVVQKLFLTPIMTINNYFISLINKIKSINQLKDRTLENLYFKDTC